MHQRSCLPGILTSRDLFAVPLAAVRIPLGLERYHREAKVVFTNATTASYRLFTRRHVLIMLDREGSFNSKTTNCSSLILFLFDPLYLSRSLSLLFSPSSFFLILLSFSNISLSSFSYISLFSSYISLSFLLIFLFLLFLFLSFLSSLYLLSLIFSLSSLLSLLSLLSPSPTPPPLPYPPYHSLSRFSLTH